MFGSGNMEMGVAGFAMMAALMVLNPIGLLAIAVGAFGKNWMLSMAYGAGLGLAAMVAVAVASGGIDKGMLSLAAVMVPIYAVCGFIGRGVRYVIAGGLVK